MSGISFDSNGFVIFSPLEIVRGYTHVFMVCHCVNLLFKVYVGRMAEFCQKQRWTNLDSLSENGLQEDIELVGYLAVCNITE